MNAPHATPLRESTAGTRRREIELRVLRPGALRVEVAGEMNDWLTPRALRESEPGVFVRRFALPEGAYAYKLRVDDAWELDESNPRTRGSGVFRNNVLSVGAAEEPLLFAAASPFVHEGDRGGLVVVAGVRRGAGERLSVVWTEDTRGATRTTPMERVSEEAEHVLFRAHLPASAERLHATFLLDGETRIGSEPRGEPFVIERTAGASTVPEWWKSALVYAIFVDRFRPAVDSSAWEKDPGADVAAGGHLDGVTRSLDAIADLGATAIYLTPVHVAASCHRYDVVDPLRVDPALGGEEAFARLVEAAHAREIRVIVDFAIGHVGRGFPPYEDVIDRGAASSCTSWFQWENGELRHYGKRTDAPLLDLDSPDVRAVAMAAIDAWARRGVDGIRLDAAAEVPIDLARALRERLRTVRPDAIVVGEVVPEHAWRWRVEGAIDAATEFAFARVSGDLFARRTTDAKAACFELASSELARGGPASTALRFVSTHDHARFATLAEVEGHPANAPLGLVHLLTSPGVPMLLYGEELGLAADVAVIEPEAAWPDRMPMRWSTSSRSDAMRALTKRLAAVRAGSPALLHGDLDVLSAEDAVLVYRRSAGGEIVDVALNGGDARVEIEIADGEHPAIELLVTVGDVGIRGATIALGPGAAIVARRSRGGPSRSQRVLQIENTRRRDSAFADGAIGAAPPPTRIDFAITEACNLRCAHCITFAPQLTRSGRARTLTPWVLDKVAGALAFAEYVGFVHGGESLVAPIFHDVLRTLRAARAGSPTTVHLLTNGVLLDERTTARIVEEGVSSISISLDGATAATNDRVRVGGDFHAICANVRAAVRLRRVHRLDVRLGISSVVLRSNVDELDAIVRLAIDLGVDWLKLEEAVPVNPFAARAIVSPSDAGLKDAVARAIETGKSSGLVVVDHTAPPDVWRCKLSEDAAMREFLAADEYANRSTIHPCRAAWERACVEPDGDVRIGDFFGPRIGNVTIDPLWTLWNGPIARAQRMGAEARRVCARDGRGFERGARCL